MYNVAAADDDGDEGISNAPEITDNNVLALLSLAHKYGRIRNLTHTNANTSMLRMAHT